MENSHIQTLLICGIVLLLFGVNYGAGEENNTGNASNSIKESAASSSFTTDWWPMFRHDSGNTGYSSSEAPAEWVEYWQYQTADFIIGSPAVVDGKIYIGSPDYYKKSRISSECISITTASLNDRRRPLYRCC